MYALTLRLGHTGAGRTIIEPKFELVRNFSEGLAPAKQRGRWGYITRSGNFAIDPRFADALSFDRGVGRVTPEGEQSGFYRYIDKTGRFTTNPDYFPEPRVNAVPPPRRKGKARIVGTFSGEEGSGSRLSVTFASNGTFVMSQRGVSAPGKYARLNLPFPEKGVGNVYYELQPADGRENGEVIKYKPRVGFHDELRDRFHFIVGDGAKSRLLQVGQHPEFTVPLDREP